MSEHPLSLLVLKDTSGPVPKTLAIPANQIMYAEAYPDCGKIVLSNGKTFTISPPKAMWRLLGNVWPGMEEAGEWKVSDGG